jgi:hypothetical protein
MSEVKPSKPYKEYLYERLTGRREAVAYLAAAAEDDDEDGYRLAVQDIFFALNPDVRAALSALETWREASVTLEQADEAVASGGVAGYPELSQRARIAFEDEQNKLAALRDAADSLRRARADEGGEG